MEILDLLSKKEWLRKRSIMLDGEGRPDFEGNQLNGITISIPSSALKIIALAEKITRYIDNKKYMGSIFWISDHVWGSDSNSMGIYVWNKIHSRECCDINCSVLYGSDEVLVQSSALLIPLFFQWDAYMIPEDGSYIVFVSHDEYLSVVTRSSEDADAFMMVMEKWNPCKKVYKNPYKIDF
jgi:hypothetical protein